jgi:hypothetical protein
MRNDIENPFGDRCKYKCVNGSDFCKIHVTNQPYGVWDGEYDGQLKILINDIIQSFTNNIDRTFGINNLEDIKRQLLNYKILSVYDELNTRIDEKIELFKSEIKKYEEMIGRCVNNSDGLERLLKELPEKEYLIGVKYKIMSMLKDIQNENDKKVLYKIGEIYNKVDIQRERLDKLYILKELFDNYASTIYSDSPKIIEFLSKTRHKLSFAIDRFESKFIVIQEETFLLDSHNNIYDVATNKYLGKYFNNKLLPISLA